MQQRYQANFIFYINNDKTTHIKYRSDKLVFMQNLNALSISYFCLYLNRSQNISLTIYSYVKKSLLNGISLCVIKSAYAVLFQKR